MGTWAAPSGPFWVALFNNAPPAWPGGNSGGNGAGAGGGSAGDAVVPPPMTLRVQVRRCAGFLCQFVCVLLSSAVVPPRMTLRVQVRARGRATVEFVCSICFFITHVLHTSCRCLLGLVVAVAVGVCDCVRALVSCCQSHISNILCSCGCLVGSVPWYEKHVKSHEPFCPFHPSLAGVLATSMIAADPYFVFVARVHAHGTPRPVQAPNPPRLHLLIS